MSLSFCAEASGDRFVPVLFMFVLCYSLMEKKEEKSERTLQSAKHFVLYTPLYFFSNEENIFSSLF